VAPAREESRGFRHGSLSDRRTFAAKKASLDKDALLPEAGTDQSMIDLADAMVESAIGYIAVPLGVATGFLINQKSYDVPMATEEPSVIAAATYAARRIALSGGFTAVQGETITSAQIYIEGCGEGAADRVTAAEDELKNAASAILSGMTRRGGGWRGIRTDLIVDRPDLLRVTIDIDVRDALGANLVNTVAENLRPVLESVTVGKCLMGIVTNAAYRRVTTAEFTLPHRLLKRAGIPGAEVARRIVLACEIARADSERAVTHNKGIMNGITALALATGNDTRASEAAVHNYACRSDHCLPLTSYESTGDVLHGSLRTPIVLGTVGGASGIHPTCQFAFRLLGSPTAGELACVAASVGLAQNFAALFALVTEGIQRGHMALHARRLAWKAGARGEEIREVAGRMSIAGDFSADAARRVLSEIRVGGANP
jgi:hydroxymethylglutaryl-CoA reductase